MSSVFQCGDPNCPGDLQAGAAACGLCGRTRSKLGPVDPGLTRPPGVRAELVLGNRFRLVRVLGAGGMGEVWLAEDLSLERAIACKVVKPDLVGDRRALVDLRSEVKLTLDLTHKSIVRVYQYHEIDGIHFIAMEYVEGQSLDHALTDRLEQDLGPFALDDVLRMLQPIATALDYAHGQGVLHRDVKPGNILLDAAGATKLADFGIASVVTDSTIRQTGKLPGYSPHYASPEQEMGEHLEPTSDQYSLAVTAYELLSGKPPFRTGNITAQRQLKPAPAIPGQPEHVNAALLKALSKAPGDRFSSCMAFVDALAGKAAVDAPPVPAAPLPEPEVVAAAWELPVGEIPKPEIRERTGSGGRWVAASLLVLLVASIVGGFLFTQSGGEKRSAQDTPAPGTAEEPPPPPEPEGPDPVLLQSVAAAKTAAEAARTEALAAGAEQHAAEALAGADQKRSAAVKAESEDALETSVNLYDDAQKAYTDVAQAARRAADQAIADQTASAEKLGSARGRAESARTRVGATERTLVPRSIQAGEQSWTKGEDKSQSGADRIAAYEEASKHFESALTLVGIRQQVADFRETLKTLSPSILASGDSDWTMAESVERDAFPRIELYKRALAAYEKAMEEATLARGTVDEIKVEAEGSTVITVTGRARFEGMSGRKVEMASYYFTGGGEPLKAGDSRYRSSKGQVYVGVNATLSSDPDVRTFTLPIPLSALGLGGGEVHGLGVEVALWDFSTKPAREVARSARTTFKLKVASAPEPAPVPSRPTPAPVPSPSPAPASPAPPPAPAGQPSAGTERSFEIAPGVSMAFVWIPAGTFTMGSPGSEAGRYGDETQRQVRISQGFWLGKYEVTQAEWRAVMGSRSNHSEYKGSRNPVENLSWDRSQEFLRKLGGGYRLPTEAEWEYACRAGTKTAYSFGDDESALGSYAWYNENSGDKTHPVGQKKPNPWGLYDMHGNVWEWCSDLYDGTSERVLRGGSWYSDALGCRAAVRHARSSGSWVSFFGFRVVRTAD